MFTSLSTIIRISTGFWLLLLLPFLSCLMHGMFSFVQYPTSCLADIYYTSNLCEQGGLERCKELLFIFVHICLYLWVWLSAYDVSM